MSFVDNNSIFVKTGLTIHKISKFQPTDTTVKVNLELYFTYKKKEVLNNFIDFYKSENNDETMKEFEQEFKFPFLISNAISIDTYQNTTNHIKINNDSDINYHNNKIGTSTDTTEFILEKYLLNCELEVVNFTHLLPFNKMVIPINIITDGTPGTENITLIEEFKIPFYNNNLENEEVKIKKIYYYEKINDTQKIKKYFNILKFLDSEYDKDNGYHFIEFENQEVDESKIFKIKKIISTNRFMLNDNIFIKIIDDWKTNNLLNSVKKYYKNNNQELNDFKKTDIVWGKFITDSTHNRVYNGREKQECCSCKCFNDIFFNKWDWYDIVNPTEYVHSGDYSRLYFLLMHSFGITEDIIKYYLIPTILTVTMILFYSIDVSSFAGLFPTILLGDIALLFIQPDTGNFTFNEKSIHLNIIMTIALCILKILKVPLYFGQLYWIIGIFLINFINLIYNIIVSIRSIRHINSIIKNKNITNIEMLFNHDYSGINNCKQDNLEEIIIV